MKHTTLICATALTLSACTCTCPENQSHFQAKEPAVQYEFQKPSHMMTLDERNINSNENFINFEKQLNSIGNFEYRHYTQIKYSQPQVQYTQPQVQYIQQPQEPEIIYYPVYQPVPAQPKTQDCGCQEYNLCGC